MIFDSYRMADEVAKELKADKFTIEMDDVMALEIARVNNGVRRQNQCSPKLTRILKKLSDEEIEGIALAISCNIHLRLQKK